MQKQPSEVFYEKKLFLKNSQHLQEKLVFSQENTGLRPSTLLKKRFQHGCFPVKISKNIYFEEHLRAAASAVVLLEFYNNTNIYEKK